MTQIQLLNRLFQDTCVYMAEGKERGRNGGREEGREGGREGGMKRGKERGRDEVQGGGRGVRKRWIPNSRFRLNTRHTLGEEAR